MTGLKKLFLFSCLSIGLIAGATPAAAQEVEPGQTEIFALVGGMTDNLGAAIGGGFQHAVRPPWLFSVEASHLTAVSNVSGFAFDGNAHYLWPIDSPQFTPYVLGGIGLVRVSAGDFSDTSAGLNLGGGARWQVGERWGLRPELKVLVSDNTHARFSVALYYKVGGR